MGFLAGKAAPCKKADGVSAVHASPVITTSRKALQRVTLSALVTLPLLFSGTLPAMARVPDTALRFHHLAVDDGLSQGAVQSIVQDATGYMWFGTQKGLNRYDGREFRHYLANRTTDVGLSDDWVWALFVDSSGVLWVGTHHGGLAAYDASRDEFRRVWATSTAVRDITETQDGMLWLATDEGVVRLNPDNSEMRHYPLGGSQEEGTALVRQVHVDGSGRLWIAGDGLGLRRYDAVQDRFVQVPYFDHSMSVNALAGDGNPYLLLGSRTHGLLRVSPVEQTVEPLLGLTGNGTNLPAVNRLLITQERSVWVGHEASGVTLIDDVRGQGDVARLTYESNAPTGLTNDHVTALYQDRAGLIWVGTQRGVSRWQPAYNRFQNFTQADGKLGKDWVAGFAEESPSQFWVATYGGGVSLVDTLSGDAEIMNAGDPDSGLADNRVTTVHKDPSGEVWMGTRYHGVSLYNPVSQEWRQFVHSDNDPNSLSGNAITAIATDPAGRIWIATHKNGVNRFDRERNRFERFSATLGNGCSDRVLGLFLDRGGYLWQATQGDGICRVDPATEQFVQFKHERQVETSLSHDVAWTVQEDATGNLWVGTENHGVNVWLAADRLAGREIFRRLNRENGFLTSGVYSLIADGLGRIWAGTERGVTRYTINNDSAELAEARHFSALDGLPGNEFNMGAVLRSSTGHLLFGGTGGFTRFDPAHEQANSVANVVITQVTVNNLATIQGSAVGSQRLELKYNENALAFDFAALEYTAPLNTRYQYQLHGFDRDWVDNGRANRATYTNLSPGEYTFRVRAALSGDNWSVAEAHIGVLVATPWWLSVPMLILYVSLVLALIVWAYRHWSGIRRTERQLRSANESLTAEIGERRAKELDLAEARQRTQQYLDVVEVVILAMDEHGRVTMINQKGLRLLGLAENKVLGEPFCEGFIAAEDRETMLETLQEAASTGAYAFVESGLVVNASEVRKLAWHIVGIDDGKGVLVSGTDVTQLRQMELMLGETHKMEALGALARGIAHDFNNILAAILGYSELTRKQIADGAPVHEHLDGVDQSVARARDIIASILTFSRATDLDREPCNLSAAVSDALVLVRPSVGNNVRLIEDIEPDVGSVLADFGYLSRLVLNLCTNAVQAVGDSGEIRVSVRHVRLDVERSRRLGLKAPGLYAQVLVEDDGVGMDDYTKSRIFEPFYTTREAGSGLGLAAVDGIVRQLEGVIHVSSEPGGGSTFAIFLPCYSNLVPIDVEVSEPDPQDLTGTESVLVVDDEEAITAIAWESLSQFGYDVITANSIEDALAVIEGGRARIDILITDKSMPGMSGEELSRRFKQRHPHQPVLMLSGYEAEPMEWVDAFLRKPYSQIQLAQKVKRLLEALKRTA